MNFYGYRRPDGRVGVRNMVLILPASVCASDTARIISSQVVGSVTFNNQLGCSQVASDQHGCDGRVCCESECVWYGCCFSGM